ncbi:hypothetical protein D3C76_1346820 [compost metagenome]
MIFILYKEGYLLKAKEYLSQMPELLKHTSGTHNKNLCFINAEMMYDEGQLRPAAEYFEKIYTNNPGCTLSRFASAACYLQLSLESLIERHEHLEQEDNYNLRMNQYIHNIYQSLHIIHHSQWHTVWTPAQRRRMDAEIKESNYPHSSQDKPY